MKKLTAVLLALVLAAALCVGAMAEGAVNYADTWVLTGIRTMSTILPPALGGIELDLTIENGKCLYDSMTAAGKGVVELLLELEEVADLGTQVTGYVQDASGNKANAVLTLVAMSDGTLI